MGIGWQLVLVGALVLTNAVFAGSELALLSLREGQLARLREQGGTGELVARLARDHNRFLATIQVGITLAGFLASATAAVTLAEPLVDPLALLGGAARPVAIVLVTAALTFVTLVFGELAPKRLALQRPERWALLVARPLVAIAAVARPVVWLLGASTDLVVRLVGGDPELGREEVDADEIRELVVAGELWSHDEREIISATLDATERVLREVVRPRPMVVSLHEDVPAEDARRRLAQVGHSRAPVHAGTLDDATRVVSLLDLVDARGPVGGHAREALALPESVPLVEALRRLQSARQSMALVVSEHGGVEGIVTVEDLVEELVGEIHDESDREGRLLTRRDDGTTDVLGHAAIHDLRDHGLALPEGEYVSVAGLVLDRLQRLPDEGDRVEVEGWQLEVRAVRGRVVERVRLHPLEESTADERAPEPGGEPRAGA